MGKLTLAIFLVFCAGLLAVHPAFADKYGELMQETYAGYNETNFPDDPYIWIKDEKVVEIFSDGSYKVTYHNIYKVIKEEARQALGEQTVPYDDAFEKVRNIDAMTISPEGCVTRASQVQELSPYSGFPMYSCNRVKVITLPEVVKDSIIEIKTVVTGKKMFAGEYWDNWYFRYDVPLLESGYKITLPAGKKISIASKDMPEPVVEKSADGKCVTYSWQKTDMEKYEPEEMAPALACSAPQIAVSTLTSWDILGRYIQDLYKSKTRSDRDIDKKVKELTAGKKTSPEKLEAILKYLRDNIRYVSLSFGDNELKPHKATETFKNKYGDCKDQCALLEAMLESAGIESTPVLVHYKTKGLLFKDAPSPSYFNHMIVQVKLDEKYYIVDPLVEGYAIEDMYLTLDNTDLFFFDTAKTGFIKESVPDIADYTNGMFIKVSLRPDGSADGEIRVVPEKASYASYRQRFKNMTQKQREEFCKSFMAIVDPAGEVVDFSYADPENYKEPFFVQIQFTAPHYMTLMGDYMVMDLNEFSPTSSFSKPARTQRIVSYLPMSYRTICEYEIPKGYDVEYLPESFVFKTPLDYYSSKYEISDGKITAEHNSELKVVDLEPGVVKKIRDVYDKMSVETKKGVIMKKNAAAKAAPDSRAAVSGQDKPQGE